MVSIDLVDLLTLMPRANKMILVVSDHFTRWKDAIAIPDSKAKTVINILDQRVFSYFGLPERILSDQGTQLESKLLKKLCHLWGVQNSRTMAYHPQGNRVVECGNKDLGDALRSLILKRHKTD